MKLERATYLRRLTEQAWAAGLFDGEGWVGAVQHGEWGPYAHISIDQNDAEVLARFRDAVGMGTVRGPYARPNRTPHYQYAKTGNAAVARIFDALHPYLSSIKIKQFEDALAQCVTRRKSYKTVGDAA